MLMILCVLVAFVLLLSLACFLLACYAPKRKSFPSDVYDIPPGPVYEPYRELMTTWIRTARQLPHENVEIISFDGLTLRGKYYECKPGAPMEIMFHGYRGNSERDMCGGVHRAFALGRNALIVDQRASGASDGHLITFGIRERKDCLSWIEFVNCRFGTQQTIILTGISMGASTVLLASGMDLPENVVGVLADCGFTSAKDIMKKVIHQVRLPADVVYKLVWLGARLFGGFDLETDSPVEAVKRCRIPVIFFHGESDDYVPCEMSRINSEACAAPNLLVTVPGAGHGLSFPVNQKRYLEELDRFGQMYWYQNH